MTNEEVIALWDGYCEDVVSNFNAEERKVILEVYGDDPEWLYNLLEVKP